MAIKFLNNIDVTGEVEGTSLDINGNADISGNLTGLDNVTSTNFIIGGHTINDIDVTSQSSNADDHLMSALAIKNRIEDFGYITSSGSISGNAATATALATSRSIGGVSFNGTSAINLPGVNQAGNQNTTGTAAIATAITVADESSDTSCNVLFSTAASGNLNPKSGSNLTFNSATGLLTATKFSGSLTGNVTGNVSGTAGGAAKGLSHLNSENAAIVGHGVIVGNTDGTGIVQVTGNATAANKFLRSRGSANAATAPTFESLAYTDLTGTVTTWNQNTTGSAATAGGLTGLTASRVMVSAGNGTSSVSPITTTKLNFLSGVTSSIQTQLDAKQASLTFGIGNTHSLRANASLADNDFLKVDGSLIEGRTASQVRSDLGIEAGATADQTQSDINSLAITTVGTITSGVWNGTAINQTYLTGQSGTNTGDVCSSDHTGAGYLTSSSTAAKVTVTDSTANTAFPVVFHDGSNALLDDDGATVGLMYNPSLGSLFIPEYLVHSGDGDTYLRFGTNTVTIMAGDTDLTARWNEAYDAINTGGVLASFSSDFSNHDSGLELVTDDPNINFGSYGSQVWDRTTLTFHGDFFKIKNDHGSGAATEVMTLDNNGRIGLNKASPLYGVHDSRASGVNSDWYLVNGSIGVGTTPHGTNGRCDITNIFTGLNFTSSSDARLKKDVKNIPSHLALNVVKQLQGVRFNWLEKHETSDWPERHQDKKINGVMDMGFIAQDVEKVLPEVVETNEDNKGFKTIAYGKMVAVLTEAIKEQQKQIDKLQKQINEL